MSNTTLTTDIVAKEALAILDNELGWVRRLHRAHESEFAQSVNGYKPGDTIRIRRPADFTVRTGATMSVQDVIEGKTTIVVDQQVGVDFNFNSIDLTLKIEDLSDRVIKPAMSSIINYMANDVATQMYRGTYNWAGTPGQTINSFSDFNKGNTRLNHMGAPMEDRCAILSPDDHGELLGAQTALYMTGPAEGAYRSANLGRIADVDVYMSQVTPIHTRGTATNSTPLTDGTAQQVTYDTAKDTWTQSLVTDGWSSSTTLKAGDVFTIDGFYMVNPRTKSSTGVLQNFVVTADVTANETTSNDTTLTISPPIIISGPHQTVTYSGTTNDRTISIMGTASTAYAQNMIFHKNAMSLAVVPMEIPQGANNVSRKSMNGFSVRVTPVYDGINDISRWRLDMLYGRKLIDPRVVTRLSGSA